MNQITNSPVKEAIRQQNENNALSRKNQIQNKLNADIARTAYKKKISGGVYAALLFGFWMVGYVCAALIASFFLMAGERTFGNTGGNIEVSTLLGCMIIGFGFGVVACILLNKRVKKKNAEIDVIKRRMEDEAENEIREAFNEADRLTVQQINAYDYEVKQYCQRVLQKEDAITSMVQHNTDMFQRMVSHADAGSNMRFVESDFTFKVQRTGIMYSYQSRYTNPQDDYNFDKQRFRNLSSDSECEGLAQALAKLTIKKMMSLYPPNSLHITVDHIDAEVTMHYKAANKNFVAARDIF